MNFWSRFKDSSNETKSLEDKLGAKFPEMEEKELAYVSSIAGLMSVIAFTDLSITEDEKQAIKTALEEWTDLTAEQIQKVVRLANEHAKEFIDLDNYVYTAVLNESMSQEQKYYLVESLFHIAASDGEVSAQESNQINALTSALKLSRNHYISARAKVQEHLKVLKP